ncbi:MAG: hypothetical protein HWN65_22830 [Candidatus Helarchaeota archaeon]|nr:hypothetical protein [Candidatus Helarchaeota archaeon]
MGLKTVRAAPVTSTTPYSFVKILSKISLKSYRKILDAAFQPQKNKPLHKYKCKY